MKLKNPDETTLMEVTELQPEGNHLVIRGTILGSMPVTCLLTPDEARMLLKMLRPRLLLFILTLPFRRAARQDPAAEPFH